jgi:hypothetical protein
MKPLCMDYPLRPGLVAQVVIPADMTSAEAARLCAFIQSLAPERRDGAAHPHGQSPLCSHNARE